MKINYLAVFCCTFFTSTSLIAGIMREDVSVQDYRDFAENLGKYAVSTKNIEVFKTDGTSAGFLNFPMPDFGAVASSGYATLLFPSYIVSVKHNGGYDAVDFGNNAKYKTTYQLINRNEHATSDFHLPRLNKVVTEAASVPYISSYDLTDTSRYSQFARVGSGTQKQVDTESQELITLSGAYNWKTGGAFVSPSLGDYKFTWLNYTPSNSLIQPLDIAAQSGDSGSPIFVYDNLEKEWKLVGILVAVGGSYPYKIRSYAFGMQMNFIEDILAANSDPDVTDVKAGGDLHWGKEQIVQGENSWSWHGVDKVLPANATNNELDASKDLRFNGEGGTLVLEQSVNQGAGKLQFSSDYRMKSAGDVNSTWVGGGIEVDANKTVLWQVNGLAGDVMHKIGEGTLHVNATGVNGGGLNVGEGTVILDQQADANGEKQAFSTVTLVSGRPVVVLADGEQIATKNIQFGYRGGTLDINGNNLSFSEINHNDNGALLVNRNTEKTGVITLYGDSFNFLGHIGEKNSGKLNLAYYASDSGYRATLSGGVDVQDLTVKRGELVLSGQQTLHAGNILYSNDWSTQSYAADNVEVQSATILTVSDHAELTANTTVAADATLNLYAHALLSGSVALTEANSLLKADIAERQSDMCELISAITADISGNGQLIKTGDGVLQVDGDITTTGDTELLKGTLALNGNVFSTVNMASSTVLGGNGTLQTLNAADGSTIYPGTLLSTTTDYATLRVGTLNTTGTVNLALNSAFSNSATDKLLVEGDVTGDKTVMVSVNARSLWADSDSNQNGVADNTEGVSIIQVGGGSSADSFQLAGNYVARGAWAYGLYAFAPGKSVESEREVDGTNGQYWDYRLQNIMLSEGDNAIPAAPEEPSIPVPDDTPEVTPDEPSTPVPDETPEVTPDEPSTPVPDDMPEVTPDEPSIPVPDDTPEVTPDEPSIPVPDETPEVTPDEPSIPVTDDTPEVTPDEPSIPVPDETPEAVPDESAATPLDEAKEAEAETPPVDQPTVSTPVRRAVTPQVPSYISLPSAMFRVEEQRTSLFKESALDAAREGNVGVFLFGYRGDETYQSGNDFIRYGYNYKSRYKGWMMGASLASWQNERQSLHFSGAWSKGDMSFTPSAADGYSQGNFHSNALNLMLSWHYDNYFLNLLSGYGWSKGNISTHLRGKVASPRVKQMLGEIEGGKAFDLGAHQVRPYAGYRHQQMQVRRFTDVDNAQVSYQQQRRKAWVTGLAYDYTLPIGALGTLRLGSDVSLATRPSGQGKVTVGDDRQSNAFHTGNGGNSLNIKTQGRLAINKAIALTTQVRHQRKLQQEGANDWLFAGGVDISF